MKTLIIGGAGYLGSVLALDSVIFDKTQGDDLNDSAQLAKALQGIKQVVHLAAMGDSACNKNPEAARLLNIEGTKALVEAAERSGVERLVFASSCSVYGWQEGLLDESAVLRPASIYGQTKAEAEGIVRKSSVPWKAVLRFATLFGRSPVMRYDTLLNQFVHDAVHLGEVKVFEPDAWRPLLHVRDAAAAITRSLYLPMDCITINIACGNYRKREIASMIRQWRPTTKVTLENGSDSKSYRVDFSRMKTLLGKPTHNPTDSIGEIA